VNAQNVQEWEEGARLTYPHLQRYEHECEQDEWAQRVLKKSVPTKDKHARKLQKSKANDIDA
jgi:hypothetical protein